MTGYIQRGFWWCAGADKDVLSNCPRSERIKHAGYGSLILVPAILAFFSSTYALSTFISNKNAYLAGGITWALIVFAIDRVIISTFRKGAAIRNDLMSVSFLARLVFAILVGFVVAHPLVMFYFDSSIVGRLDDKRRDEISKINKTYDESVATQEAKKAELEQAIGKIQGQKDSDVKQRESELLTVMGVRRSRRRVSELKNIRKRLIEERNESIRQINAQKPPIDTKIADYEKARQNDLQHYSQPRDYLAKEDALSDLTERSSVVRWTQRLVILLFVFIDILPITFKVTTKRGAYDSLLESSNQRVINETTMEDEVHGEILDRVKERQKEKVTEIIEAKYKSPEFLQALDSDITTMITRSLVRTVGVQPAIASPVNTPTSAKPNGQPAENTQVIQKKWLEQVKDKFKDRWMELIVTLICLPLQALVLLGYYLYGISDVWQDVASGTLLKMLPLLLFNFGMNKLLKPLLKPKSD
jgi:hypothetical protein